MSLRGPGAELEGVSIPPIRWWKIWRPIRVRVNWFIQNRLKNNPLKTDMLHVNVNSSKIKVEHIEIHFGDAKIRPSPFVKILGVIIDSNLNCERQLSALKRCYSILVGLAKLSQQLRCETKRIIIEGLIHSYIRYCITVMLFKNTILLEVQSFVTALPACR